MPGVKQAPRWQEMCRTHPALRGLIGGLTPCRRRISATPSLAILRGPPASVRTVGWSGARDPRAAPVAPGRRPCQRGDLWAKTRSRPHREGQVHRRGRLWTTMGSQSDSPLNLLPGKVAAAGV